MIGQARRRQWMRALWALFFIGFLGACMVTVVFALLPGYTSTNSKSWSEPRGYPALLRALGWPIPVPIGEVEQRRFEQIVAAGGTLEYFAPVQIAVDVTGVVTSVDAPLGTQVRVGDPLITVNDGGVAIELARLEVRQREIDFEQNRRQYTRDTAALNRGLLAQSAYEATERSYQESVVRLARAREGFARALQSLSQRIYGGGRPDPSRLVGEAAAPQPLKIVAPVDGTVVDLDIRVGQTILDSRRGVMTIGTEMEFRAIVDQRDIRRVNVGDPAVVRLVALPGTELQATVERIEPTVAGPPGTSGPGRIEGTVFVWLRLTGVPEGVRLIAGMSGYTVLRRPLEALAVPESAVSRLSGGEGTLLTIDNLDRVNVVPVRYSVREDGWVSIVSGPPAGTRIVLDGQIGLRAGDQVRAQ